MAKRKRKTVMPGDDIRKAVAEAQLVSVEAAERAEKIRNTARERRDEAEVLLAKNLARLKRAVTRIDKYQKRAAYFARRAAVTNVEVQEEMRQAAAAKKGAV